MLNVLRENVKKTPYLKWVLGLVAVGLVLYLGNYFISDTGGGPTAGTWAARVNGVEIPTQRFIEAARNIDQYYRQLFGDRYDQFRASFQISQQAVQQLIDQEMILQDARRLGLSSSKRDLAEQIRSIPSLQDAAGQFVGTERYRELVERGVTGGVTAFEQGIADDLLARMWTDMITEPVTIADAELKEAFRKRTEKTAIDYLVFNASDEDAGTQVTDEELQLWYDEHPQDYRHGEGRRIRYIVIDREAQSAAAQVSEDDVRAHYETNQNDYTHPEQRRAEHILVRIEGEGSEQDKQRARGQAEQLLDRLRAGEDFATLARSVSQDVTTSAEGGDLGFFARGEMFPSVEQAVFDSAVGEFAPITDSPHGIHVIRVTDSRDEGVSPFEQVAAEIRRSLELEAAQEGLRNEAERLRGEIATADRLQQVADTEELAVETLLVTGRRELLDLGASPEMIAAIDSLEVGGMSEPLALASGLALVALDEIVPPGLAPLDEVRSELTDDVLADRAVQAALARGRQALDKHGKPSAVAKALDLELKSSGSLAPGRTLPEAGGPAPEFSRELFADGAVVGASGVIPVPAGAVIYEITAREPFDPERFESDKSQLREELLTQRRAVYRQSILEQLRTGQEIEINYSLLQRFSG